ncbi:hypothetical protein Ciccas_001223 [Cichlidogyrus casuarinus]|uniref:PEHE domain-containing protein n=1 Tax=Cichlidogyrus casuarinus TaxID=1844966 RepID=A0ABD2QKP4_9PLAT
MTALVSSINLSSDFNQMHDLRHLKVPSRNLNRANNDPSRLRKTLSPRDLNIPNSLRSPRALGKQDKIARFRANDTESDDEFRKPVLEISINRYNSSLRTSLPITITSDSSSNSDTYHSAVSDVADLSPKPEPKRKLRSSESRNSPDMSKRTRKIEGESKLPPKRVPQPKVPFTVQVVPQSRTPRQNKKKSRACSYLPLNAKFHYTQPLFLNNLPQPLHVAKSGSFIENKIFALENLDEFDKACIRQSNIEVPSWRALDEKTIQSQLNQVSKSRKASDPSQKEDSTDQAYRLRHTKPEQLEIKRERRCMQLQHDHDRRAYLEERDQFSRHKRKPQFPIECPNAVPGPTSLVSNVSEEQALRHTPRQLTLSPCKSAFYLPFSNTCSVKSFRVTDSVTVKAFGALVPACEQKSVFLSFFKCFFHRHFSLAELKRFSSPMR